jgi:hypothetical protein
MKLTLDSLRSSLLGQANCQRTMVRWLACSLVWAMFFFVITPAAQAVVMVPLAIEELSAKAQLVVHATVLSKSCQRDSANRIYTKVELRIIETWKGTRSNDRLTIVHGGGILGEERVEVSGQVDYQIGEKVVAFVVFNQRGEGVTLGLAQGKFHVWQNQSDGVHYARNPFHGTPEISTSQSNLPSARADSPGSSKSAAAAPLTLTGLKAKVTGEAK